MTPTRISRRSHRRIVALCAATPIFFAACAGGSTSSESGIASLDTIAVAGDSAGSEAAPTTEAKSDDELAADADKAVEDYEKCLKDLGIDSSVFLGGGDEGGAAVETVGDDESAEAEGSFDAITDEQFERMQDECEPMLAAIDNGFDLSPEQQAEFRDVELKFAQCMRDNGIDDFPDPAAQGAGVDGEDVDGGFAIEIDEGGVETFEAAAEVCDSVFEDAFEQSVSADGES